MENEDKVVKIETIEQSMSVQLQDGTKVPTSGKIIYTHYASGRKDCKVVVSRI